MDFNQFRETTLGDLKEGDYVLINLDKEFILQQIKNQAEMLNPPQPAATGVPPNGTAPVTPVVNPATAVGLPANFTIEPPSYVIGLVDEVVVDVIGLKKAYEEGSDKGEAKAYEARQCSQIRTITEDQYTCVKKLLVDEAVDNQVV